MKEDTKILLSVAGFVVAGAIGIAVVGALSLDGQRDTDAVAVTTSPERVEVDPVTFTAPVPSYDVPGSRITAAETIPSADVDAGVVGEQPFEVQPGEDYVTRGLETYHAREFDKAAAYFSAAADERPGRAWTHYMLALSLWKSGSLDDAVVEMERSAEIDGGSVKTFVNLARIQNDRGDFEAALDAAGVAVADDPDSAEALFLEGRSLSR